MGKNIIRKAKKSDIKAIVNLHMATLKNGLFYELGKGILKKLYSYALSNDNAFLIVGEDKGQIIAVILFFNDIDRFLNGLRRKYAFDLMFGLAKLSLKKPSTITSVLSSFFYGNIPKAELFFIFVDKNYQKTGIGKRLIEKINLEFKKQGIKEYGVIVGFSNREAKKFYGKCGFNKQKKKAFIKKDREVYIKNLLD